MKKITKKEAFSLLITILTLTFIFSYNDQQPAFIASYWIKNLIRTFFMAGAVVLVHDFAHKITARRYGGETEHKIWGIKRYWFAKHTISKKPIPIGSIIAVIITFASKGLFYFTAIESYDITQEKKRRIGRKWMNIREFEHALIAFAGPAASMLFALILQAFNPTGILSLFITMNVTYALYHMLPISSLDGCKIFFSAKHFYVFTAILLIILALILKSLTAFQAITMATILAGITTAVIWYLGSEKSL